MDKREITKIKYWKMYWALKEVHTLTSAYQFGSGYLPQIFTESLCRYLFGLSHYQKSDKKFDAIEHKGETVEIKATLSDTGFTSINPTSKFTYIYWMYFNFNKNKLYIYKMKGEQFYKNKYILDIIKSNESSKRVTVNLNRVFKQKMLILMCTFAKV